MNMADFMCFKFALLIKSFTFDRSQRIKPDKNELIESIPSASYCPILLNSFIGMTALYYSILTLLVSCASFRSILITRENAVYELCILSKSSLSSSIVGTSAEEETQGEIQCGRMSF